MKRLILLISLGLISNFSIAQSIDSFALDQTTFVKQAISLIGDSDHEKCKETASEMPKYFAKSYNPDQMVRIRDISEKMLSMKMRVFPHFEHFFRSLNVMAEENQTSKIESYLSTVEKVIGTLKTGRYTPYKNFLSFTNVLFEKNALYATSSGGWTPSSSSFKFEMDGDKPTVVYEDIDLVGYRNKDSIKIKKTSGRYYPTDFIWKGTKGTVDWERQEMSGSTAVVNFEDYVLEVKKSAYEVKEAELTYPAFFKNKVKGSFKDRIVTGAGVATSYPRFDSEVSKLTIDNIGKGIVYTGGFSLYGVDVVGFGQKDLSATIDFYNSKNELAVRAVSNDFIIRNTKTVVSKGASASMYFNEDSIYHPNVGFQFDIEERTLTLSREGSGSRNSPFFDSYHKFDLKTKNIVWMIDGQEIQIGKQTLTSSSDPRITLESFNYFDERKYLKYQGIGTTNPLAQIRNYAEKMDTREIHGEDLATAMNPKYDLSIILSTINNLVEDGFVYYNPETKMVTIKEKVFNWADAKTKKVDFDVLRIRGTMEKVSDKNKEKKASGSINLEDNSMELYGVKNMIISDSQLVVAKPLDGDLKVMKNRDMEFDGQVYAGFGIFNGIGNKFNYKLFNISMDTVKSLVIRTQVDEDVDGTPIIAPLSSRIEGMRGSIQIDAPGNKSSTENIAEFPSFESLTKSRVYYQDRKTQNRAYKKDDFYFELEPFTLDSLDGFDPSGLGFEGEMNTAGIFPAFKEKLRIQSDDQSLGFTSKAPPGGFDLYSKDGSPKGKFDNEISLSNKGLIGKGEINYINAEIESDEILFLPDKMQAKSKSFGMEEKRGGDVEFPEVSADEVLVDWEPYKDSMYIKSTEEKPFEFFDKEKKLDGGLVLSPGGLFGEGTLNWDEASMSSKAMLFGANGVSSDTANLSIKALDSQDEKLAFNTKNVSTKLDFDKGLATFESNDKKKANTELPFNEFRTSMDKFDWDMKGQNIMFRSSTGVGSFVSTKRSQDSLNFNGTNAGYNLNTNILKIEGVPNIKVADAIITPSDGKVVINPGAQIQQLTNATILASVTNKYHTINKANVTVEGRNKYTANGFYEYNIPNKQQEIEFNNIQVKRTKKKQYVSAGSGIIRPADNFLVDERISYHGSVNLSSNSKNLVFKGYAKLNSTKIPRTDWFSIKSKVDKKNVLLEFKKLVNQDGIKLHSGLLVDLDTALVYPSIMRAPRARKDMKFFTAHGIVKHDKSSNQFIMGDSAKVAAGALKGNKMVFDENSGAIICEGRYNLDKGFFKNVSLITAGKVQTSFVNKEKVRMELMMAIDLPLPDKLLEVIANDLNSYTSDLPQITYGSHVDNTLAEFISEEKLYNRAVTSAKEGFSFALPEKEQHDFFISKLNMKWDRDLLGFQSKGKIGLHSINNKKIERMISGYLEIQKIFGQQDKFSILIESPSEDWYYITYQNRILKTVSSNESYNDVLFSLKKNELKTKMKDGGVLEITLADPMDMNFFKGRMR